MAFQVLVVADRLLVRLTKISRLAMPFFIPHEALHLKETVPVFHLGDLLFLFFAEGHDLLFIEFLHVVFEPLLVGYLNCRRLRNEPLLRIHASLLPLPVLLVDIFHVVLLAGVQ